MEYVYITIVDLFHEEGWQWWHAAPWLEPADRNGGLDAAVARAKEVISRSRYWEPDTLRPDGGPWYMRLPTGGYEGPQYAVALKIDNNGSTFIYSPCRLPWLDHAQDLPGRGLDVTRM